MFRRIESKAETKTETSKIKFCWQTIRMHENEEAAYLDVDGATVAPDLTRHAVVHDRCLYAA